MDCQYLQWIWSVSLFYLEMKIYSLKTYHLGQRALVLRTDASDVFVRFTDFSLKFSLL